MSQEQKKNSENFSFKSMFFTLASLLKVLPQKYKWKLFALFCFQITSALLEVVSLGSIIPFLNILADFDGFVVKPYVSSVLAILDIQEKAHIIALSSGVFAIMVCCTNIFKVVALWFQYRLAASMDVELASMVYKKMLHKPYHFFLDNNSSELVGNLTHDLRASFSSLQSVLTLASQGLVTISIITSLLFYDLVSTIYLLGSCLAGYLVITFWSQRKIHGYGAVLSKSYQESLKVLNESFGGIRYVILNNGYYIFEKKYRKQYHRHRVASISSKILLQVPRFIIESIGILVICTLLIALSLSDVHTKAFLPFLGFLAMASLRLVSSINQCYSAFSSLFATNFSLQKIIAFLGFVELKEHFSQTLVPSCLPVTRELTFSKVFFRYNSHPEKDWILSDLSVTIKTNSMVAIIGTTGSGKSTFADILLGLIPPDKGELRVDGELLNQSNMAAWQSGVAHVPQHIFMADASITENIALGIPVEEIDDKRIKEVAVQAQIHGFVQTLPRKYDTLVGEHGTRLSGGQIQRIGIARALYKRPQLIVFDEATSALDTVTEKAVMDSIHGIAGEQIFIIIAHRLSSVKNVDTIFVLEKGKLVSQGTYSELLEKSTAFKSFIEAQKVNSK